MIVTLPDGNLHVKLIDFNTAIKIDDEDRIQEKTGFVPFRAPEMCPGSVDHPSGFSADVWSLGAVLYFMVT